MISMPTERPTTLRTRGGEKLITNGNVHLPVQLWSEDKTTQQVGKLGEASDKETISRNVLLMMRQDGLFVLAPRMLEPEN